MELVLGLVVGFVLGLAVAVRFGLEARLHAFKVRFGAIGHAARHAGTFEACRFGSCRKLQAK